MTDIVDELRARALQGRFNLEAADEIEQMRAALSELGVTPEEARAGVARSKAIREERDALRLRIKAAEKERDALRAELGTIGAKVPAEYCAYSKDWRESDTAGRIDWLIAMYESVKEDRDALSAELDALKRQEPVGVVVLFGERLKEISWRKGKLPDVGTKLYALTIPAQSVPDGWLRAIDEALVTAHIGVANAHDTYEQAKAKLDSLLGFHVDVATDPAVNGGWKLMPIEPTKEIYECFAAYDGTSYSNPFDFDDFKADYAFALAAAPEAKRARKAAKRAQLESKP